MELKRRLNFRKILTILYIVAFFVYIVVGLQPAEARNYEISGELVIPSIGLKSDVAKLELENHRLETPDEIVGSYSRYSSKTFLIGHSSTVFKNLSTVSLGDLIYYNDETFRVVEIKTLAKNEINMDTVLAPNSEPTIMIMTCAGEPLADHDATHRLIVTATKVFANE